MPPIHLLHEPVTEYLPCQVSAQAVGAPDKFRQKVAGRVPCLGKESLALPPSWDAEASVSISGIKGLGLAVCVGKRQSWGRTRAEQIAGKWRTPRRTRGKAESVMLDGWEITAVKKDLISACGISFCRLLFYYSFCFCLHGVKNGVPACKNFPRKRR